MKKLIITIMFCLLVTPSLGGILDAPHNETNGIKCNTCHIYSTWWQYSPADTSSSTYSARVNGICLSCHDGTVSTPVMQLHNSTTFGGVPDAWSTDCINCHNPHHQAQLTTWIDTNPAELFLVTGLIETIENGDSTFSYSYINNADNTSDIAIDSAATDPDPGWESSANWNRKNNNADFTRGLIFVHGTGEAYNTYTVTSATDSAITVKGSFDPANVDPSQDASFGLIYGQLIRSEILAASVIDPSTKIKKPVKFFTPNLLNSLGGFTDQETPRQGICQVCHINTEDWTEDGLKDGHNSTEVCTTCHMRHEGFKASVSGHKDGDGTFGWDGNCADCHDQSGTNSIITDVHQVGSNNDCSICHQTTTGGLPLHGSASTTLGALPHLCSQCHIDSNNQHHGTSTAQNGDCTWCHSDPRPQWETTFSVTGTKPRQLACRECHVKPDGTGLVVYKLDFPVTPADTMTFTGGDLSLVPDNAKSVIQTVMDGTNGTTNHSITGPTKIDPYNFGACLSCHDGTTATQVNVWHARPKYSEIPTDTGTDAYRMHFDTLRYAPGRSIFNFWRGNGSQNEPYFSHDIEFYDTSGDAQTRGKDFFDDQNNRSITWNWGATTSPYTLTTIPCFRNSGLGNDDEGLCGENSSAANEMVPVFSDGPTEDVIQVSLASYDGLGIIVMASNSQGNLSISYDGVDYGSMTSLGDNRWVKNINILDYTATTIDIITSNWLGTSVLDFPVCNDDHVTFGNATWTPSAANSGTLSVTATSAMGGTSQLQAIYNGTSYPMLYVDNQWTYSQTMLPYSETIDIIGQCGNSTANLVSDLSDQITINSAIWDGTNLTISVINSIPGANLFADYNSGTNMPLTEDTPNNWTLTSAQPVYSPTVHVWSDALGDITLIVNNQQILTYPPDCNSNITWDKIYTPLDKSRFDPDNDNELNVRAINNINTSYGAQLFMTYSLTEDGLTRYSLPWESFRTFEFIGTGFTWAKGANVTVWSEDQYGAIMYVLCDYPVESKGIDDIVTVTKANWAPDSGDMGTLTVWAENNATNTVQAYLDYDNLAAKPMIWNAITAMWQVVVTDVDYSDIVRVHTDGEGDTSATVSNLAPDTITLTQASWRQVATSDILMVRATNTIGNQNQLYINYHGITDVPMAWNNIDQIWELAITQVGYDSTIDIISNRPGVATYPVDDMTDTHLNLSYTAECVVCHTAPDINFAIHQAKCDFCHQSIDPIVLTNGVPSGLSDYYCTTCHIPSSGNIQVKELSFNYGTTTAIPLKDHNRPDSDIMVPLPEYVIESHNGPAAFPKGAAITFKTVFQAQNGINSAQIGSTLFAPQTVPFTNGISPPVYFTLPASVSQDAGNSLLDFDWYYCDENSSGFPDCQNGQPMHITSHQLYITHAPPAGTAPYYAKLVELSSQWSMDAITELEIVDSIFDGIWILGSYGYSYEFPFLARTGNDVADIFREKSGACGEWSVFMLRAIEVQGIDVYTVDIQLDRRDNYVAEMAALGNPTDLWLYGDHAFVIYGSDIADIDDETIGTAYDPSFHLTGPGWGGYEDVLFPYLEEDDIWYDNPGYGNGPEDDVLDSELRQSQDDPIFIEQ